MEDWDGKDRRNPEGLLIAVMNQVSTQVEEVEKRHEERYNILDKKLGNLQQSLDSWLEKEPHSILTKCEQMIDEMIPTHPENQDASLHEKRKEHRQAHSKWIADVHQEMALWRKVREEVTKWAVISALGFAAIAIWKLFLQGPQ